MIHGLQLPEWQHVPQAVFHDAQYQSLSHKRATSHCKAADCDSPIIARHGLSAPAGVDWIKTAVVGGSVTASQLAPTQDTIVYERREVRLSSEWDLVNQRCVGAAGPLRRAIKNCLHEGGSSVILVI